MIETGLVRYATVRYDTVSRWKINKASPVVRRQASQWRPFPPFPMPFPEIHLPMFPPLITHSVHPLRNPIASPHRLILLGDIESVVRREKPRAGRLPFAVSPGFINGFRLGNALRFVGVSTLERNSRSRNTVRSRGTKSEPGSSSTLKSFSFSESPHPTTDATRRAFHRRPRPCVCASRCSLAIRQCPASIGSSPQVPSFRAAQPRIPH